MKQDKHPQITAKLKQIVDSFYNRERNKVTNEFKTVKK